MNANPIADLEQLRRQRVAVHVVACLLQSRHWTRTLAFRWTSSIGRSGSRAVSIARRRFDTYMAGGSHLRRLTHRTSFPRGLECLASPCCLPKRRPRSASPWPTPLGDSGESAKRSFWPISFTLASLVPFARHKSCSAFQADWPWRM